MFYPFLFTLAWTLTMQWPMRLPFFSARIVRWKKYLYKNLRRHLKYPSLPLVDKRRHLANTSLPPICLRRMWTTPKEKNIHINNSKNLVYIRLQSTDGWILKKTGNLDRKSGSEGGNQKVTIATEKKWV